jgi:hypothetical protein
LAEIADQSYGKRPAYRLQAWCNNCGWEGEVRRALGVVPNPMGHCPQCEVSARLRYGQFTGRDDA